MSTNHISISTTILTVSSHSIAVVTPQATESPARYLGPDDRVLTVKAEAAANVMFVLCVYSPGPAILEIVNSINQNVCTYYTCTLPLSHTHTLTCFPSHSHSLTCSPTHSYLLPPSLPSLTLSHAPSLSLPSLCSQHMLMRSTAVPVVTW